MMNLHISGSTLDNLKAVKTSFKTKFITLNTRCSNEISPINSIDCRFMTLNVYLVHSI